MGLPALGLGQPGRILTASAIYTPFDGSSGNGVAVANKYGSSRRIAADVGIVELPNRPIVIAAFVLSDDPKDRARREILARMSRLVIEAVDPGAVTALPEPPAPLDRAP